MTEADMCYPLSAETYSPSIHADIGGESLHDGNTAAGDHFVVESGSWLNSIAYFRLGPIIAQEKCTNDQSESPFYSQSRLIPPDATHAI
jgi:hypothetical protein